MIRAYLRVNGRVASQELTVGEPLPPGTIWVDLLRPEEAERNYLAACLSIDLPTREEMKEIEASSQLYLEGDILYLTTQVISRVESPHPEHGELTFVLTPRHLVTMRYGDPRSITQFAVRITRQPELMASAEDALLGLLDAVIDRTADVLELIGSRIDALSSRVFNGNGGPSDNPDPQDLRDVMRGIGWAGDLNHKVRASLAGLDRLVTFLTAQTTTRLTKDQKGVVKTLNRDLRSLNQQAGFLAQEASFLLDATLGLINIEQNFIIKIFSVAATAFLPPTLIASIYGMNFHHMPELDWTWGYPMALVAMVLSAVVPLWYFRRKGWL